MATNILLIGKSGSGKSFSMHNLNKEDYALIQVENKPLPFRTDKKGANANEVAKVIEYISSYVNKGVKNIVVDDAGYLLTDMLMGAQDGDKRGNKVFELYTQMATQFWSLIKYAQSLPNDVIVIFTMHEDSNEFGEIKPKTIGKMLDEKVCIEGLFTIVLRALKKDNGYIFQTNTDGGDITKSPFEMFEKEIPNDLDLVIKKVREYYAI